MENLINWAYYALTVFFLIAAVCYHKSAGKLLTYLQSNHKDKVEELGFSLKRNSMGVALSDLNRMTKFLKSYEYFNDGQVEQMKKRTILYDRTCKIFLALLFIGSVILYISKK